MLSPEECYRISWIVYRSGFSASGDVYGDDLVQEGVIGIWRGQSAYRVGLASERSFASRLARNAMVDALRKWSRPTAPVVPPFDHEGNREPAFVEDLSLPEASETLRSVERTASHDPALRHWRAILAGRLGGLADGEIARRLGVSKATISRQASRLASLAAATLGIVHPSGQPASG